MDAILIYLLKMLICSAVFFMYYRLVLYNRNFHQWNRFYLISSMLLSVVIPFIRIPFFSQQVPENLSQAIAFLPWNSAEKTFDNAGLYSGSELLLGGVLIVSALLLIRVLIGFGKLLYFYHTSSVSQLNPDVRLILTKLTHAPFSFFQWLFWREDIDPASDSGQRILQHELTHIRQRHSIDKLVTEILICIFWMNPFFWLIRRELAAVHEFIADQKAIGSRDGAAFANMILKAMQVQPVITNGLVSPFFSSQIKRRLHMITNSKDPRFSYMRRISGLIVMISAFFILGFTTRPAEMQQFIKNNSLQSVEIIEVIADTIFIAEAPQPLMDKAITILPSAKYTEVRRPAISNSKRVQAPGLFRSSSNDSIPPIYILDGREVTKEELDKLDPDEIATIDITKNSFAIEKYGKRGSGGVIFIRTKGASDGYSSTKKASYKEIVVIGYATPGGKKPDQNIEGKDVRNKEIIVEGKKTNTDQRLEIREEKRLTEIPEKESTKIKLRGMKSGNSPLFFVDGKEINAAEMENLDTDRIESITVLKDASAIAVYGARAADGVIVIKMKK